MILLVNEIIATFGFTLWSVTVINSSLNGY